jgi:conjugal transfer mating pair stabilization protein TraN
MRDSPFIQRAIAYLLSLTITLIPLHGIAAESTEVDTEDFLSQFGREGQLLGAELGAEAKAAPPQVQNGQITIPARNEDGILSYQGATQLSVDSLYPGTNADNASLKQQYFPDGEKPNLSLIQETHNSEEDMGQTGNDAKGSLWEDAYSDTPSISGQAYKLLIDSSNLTRPDFSNDPMMGQTNHTYENIDVIAEGFGDCTAETSFNDVSMPVHNPEYETCDRVKDQSATCEVIHDYEAAVVKHHDGPYNITPCEDGSACSDVWIGRVGNNYWPGDCTIYEEFTEIQIVNPDAITSVTLVRAQWDDYMQIWIGEPGSEVKVWQGPEHKGSHFPPETGRNSCELKTSWDENPNLDLTRYFKNAPAGSVIRFKIRVSVTGDGEGYGKLKIRYDPSKAIVKDEWSPDSCIESALGVTDGFATGSISCISDPRDAEGCTKTNGIPVCEEDLAPSPIPGVPNLCKKVQVTADYDFYKGQLECYTDINGEEQCPVNEGGNLNSCTELEENPQCGFISSECVEGAQGESGVCYVQEETWDCGTTSTIDTVEKSTEYQCAGEIRCMGDDCLDPTQGQDQTGNFAKANALLNAAQFMTQDMSCTGVDDDGTATGEENVTCTAFGGEAGECKIAVGGVSDCCEKPSNVTMADYLTMIRSVPKLDGAVLALEDGNIVKSSYQTLREPVMEAWTEVSQPFTNYMDNISGVVEEIWSPIEELKNQLIEELKEQAKKMMQDVMGSLAQDSTTEAAATAAADQAAEEAMNEMAKQAMSMLGTAMTVYTVYVVAVAVIQMVWACEQEELEMNTKRATDSCTYIGSYCYSEFLGACSEKRKVYCCFNSPLSRIIQEQVRPQFGEDFGTPKEPICGGIPFDQIATINWDEVNLDEWIAILHENGHMPTADSLSMDALTGSGSAFNLNGDRKPADERAMDRVDDIDVDAKRREASEMVPIDPSGSAGPSQ